ncbi:MAG: hypothetical protein COA90_11505 [Gammaproteobacteria bacterium]|nr:MAG: hypothetical protein COA90_11505 [Gammaproteobacteria bacterium]
MSEHDIYMNDIQPLSPALNFIQQKNASPIMSGQFRYNTFQNGLTSHATDAVEEQDADITTELPAGISFNFLFAGTIDYSFGSNKYQLSKEKGLVVQGSVIVNNTDEILTRHLTSGMHIRKLNIFVEQQWLTSRCQNETDRQVINDIFHKQIVYPWQPAQQATEKADALIKLSNEQTFSQNLTSEHLTMELLGYCLDEVYRQVKSEQGQENFDNNNTESSLKAKVDTCLDSVYTLADIALQLNMSVSTLQRQFKKNYSLNVSVYIKKRRLEAAKKSLLVNELSIGEVAYNAGYNHSSNFINAFKKSFNITPAAYVKLHKIR